MSALARSGPAPAAAVMRSLGPWRPPARCVFAALGRLERAGLVARSTGRARTRPERRYRLTAGGASSLDEWELLRRALCRARKSAAGFRGR